MKKGSRMKSVKSFLLIGLVCLAVFSEAWAREFRSPLPMIRGVMQCPIEPYKEDTTWTYEGWVGAYARNSDRAYKNGTDTEPLSTILFGQECFRIVDSLANKGDGVLAPSNPFAVISALRPDFAYNENGVVVGLKIERKLNNHLRLGFRTAVPFRNIWGIPTPCSYGSCACMQGANLTIDDVVFNDVESQDGATYKDAFAYRLDFLAALTNTDYPPNLVEPLITFTPPVQTTLNDFKLGAASASPGVQPAPGVHVKRSASNPPALPFGATSSVVLASPIVSADGSIPAGQQQRGRFDTTTDYTPLGSSDASMSQLWVVPTFSDDGQTISNEANTLRDMVERRINDIEFDSAAEFLTSKGICYAQTVNTGVGDWDMQMYLAYDVFEWWLARGLIGVRWPTGERIHNPNVLLKFPTGNNGHFELLLGIENYARLFDWFGVHLNADYNFVFNREEAINAAFYGSCVKNIGPCTAADIHWGYFNLKAGLTFFHPQNDCMGFDVTYDFYAKTHDRIKFKCNSLTDFFGNCSATSGETAARLTNQFGHTIRGEVFYQYKELYICGGATHVFAGKNMPRESDVYLMFKLEF